MQSVPISTNVVSSNPTNGDVNSIQHYKVLKFVSDLRRSSTSKTDSHDIAEILLKVALNSLITTLTLNFNGISRNIYKIYLFQSAAWN